MKQANGSTGMFMCVDFRSHCFFTDQLIQTLIFQDAQEFSKLFLSLLEDTLSKQKNTNLQNVIQQQFCGQFSYVTV